MFMLDEILSHKVQEVKEKQSLVPLKEIKEKIASARMPRDFYGALKKPGISLIAEVKRKSPSKGELRTDFDALSLARMYAKYGARAISVLADVKYFGGGAHVVERIANDSQVQVPVMYKEFIIDPYQIYEARAVGADAVLMIVRAIEPDRLPEMIETAHDLGMQALVECFTAEEAERAVTAGARIVGINNRDLQSFEVDLARSEDIRRVLPEGVVTVSESGLTCGADARKAEALGFDAMLVGEAILKAQDVPARVREFAYSYMGTQV
ncbi:indole-3-glycerol phosphate synthase TrpC [Xylanibacillus composti]|uniref:Indole-3-glycerol phosphate synthase n=1 Tax=Xylanibacillus composti TaxID=1572762 RepID=A0A8J4H1V1_9BACL|nr:indole-3-glycerol phosphate synthase TrpC [Xylanibacillus composti]MDT9726189.1 indole-3-glycerol phosphate synthase TrpC [Xylanibacillus composti]GIQ68035.1 indole-3-glycerol phosphate synthase [Xylanibacillus composti]